MSEVDPIGGAGSSASEAQCRPGRGVGWTSMLARLSMGVLLFEAFTGLVITFGPFHVAVQWTVLAHTAVGALTLAPLAWYCGRHWFEYREHAPSHVVLLGYVGLFGLLVCSVSGLVVTWQGFFGPRTSAGWRTIHLVSTCVALGTILPHVTFSFVRVWRNGARGALRGYVFRASAGFMAGIAAVMGLSLIDPGHRYVNQFPEGYNFLYGTNRPFAPSLARTDTGGAFDGRSLAGSASCGTSGCHRQIVEEWTPSAHRYAAMDTLFQGIQSVMAEQNGSESTRYCGGCHDPISLFSGTKNIFVKELTTLHGYQEGVSCLACHAIRETDIKGNANYTVTQPRQYLWQWSVAGLGRLTRDFLIRAYPDEHNKLSKRMFKRPEYCAACHKQFIDQEVNRVGWVQLQNQYDNWAASHWNRPGDARKTVECRECHMPLVDSTDPSAGDPSDYNRSPTDRKHRSHRFIASNQLMPAVLRLEGWEEQVRLTERWLQGRFDVPEIRSKWAEGPIVKMALSVPESVAPGDSIPLRVILASNKVGHDYPTGPLDFIQSWIQITVTDGVGNTVFSSGTRDEKHFIEPGTFLFKAEPVDQHGNLIDRHNLWEMVGVRYRRALFPGYSDAVSYMIPCSGAISNRPPGQVEVAELPERRVDVPAPAKAGRYHIAVSLQYRKVDQFLLNFLRGATNQLTAPVTEIVRATATVSVRDQPQSTAGVRHDVIAGPDPAHGRR